jgi:hypothetical protein
MEEFIVSVGVVSCFVGLYLYGVWNSGNEVVVEPIEDRTNKTYTAEELMVVTNYDLTSEEVANKLGRTVSAIQAKRWSLNRQSNKGVINE